MVSTGDNSTERKSSDLLFNVINLDKDTERWDRAVAELTGKAGGVQHEDQIRRFSAVSGKDMSYEELKQNTTTLARMLVPPGILGSFLSHRNLLRKISEEDYEYQVIMEDDVTVTSDFLHKVETCIEELQNCAETRDKWDVLMLGAFSCVHPNKLYGLYIIQALLAGSLRWPRFITEHVHVPLRPLGAHAYVVSKRGAIKLSKRLIKANYYFDAVAWGDRNLNLYICHPMICYQDYVSPHNTVGSTMHNIEKLLIPNIQLDNYTKIHMQWALSEPLFCIGPVVITIGRFFIYGIIGIIITCSLPGTSLTLPLHILTYVGFAVLFFRIMMRVPPPTEHHEH